MSPRASRAPDAAVRGRDATAIVGRALRDPNAPPPKPAGIEGAALAAAASHHRVLLLLGWVLRDAGTLAAWPPNFVAAFEQVEPGAVAVDCVRHAELVQIVDALTSGGVRMLLFKGAALAHTHYPASHVRIRTDTDLLVTASDVPTLEHLLGRLGYDRPPEISGSLVSYQSHYQRTDRHGVTHAFDVHWKISNLQALADRLTFEELWASRGPVPALGPSAATVSDVHALLLALVHRAGHHPGSRDLLWIYDLHLLVGRLTPEEMLQVQELADARGLSQITGDGLALAREWFGTAAVDRIVDALRSQAPQQGSAAGIHGPWSQADVLRLDLSALSSWRARGRLIREHLLPPARYMQARYGVRSNLLLPGLYAWRVLLGAPKWLRGHAPED